MTRLMRRRTAVGLALIMTLILAGCATNQPSVFHTSTQGYNEPSSVSQSNVVRVPWDYRIIEGTVGDLIGSDMVLLPDNIMLANDDNYATGDQVWMLQFMDAEIITDPSDNSNDIRLSSWETIKSYKTEDAAIEDLTNLKLAVTAEVDLVGVYKTEYQGQTRNFAVVELPSGNRIKQPINDDRYADFAEKKTVEVRLEEVHDFAEYDLAFAKFRGWAN